jgi:hypothetical protein
MELTPPSPAGITNERQRRRFARYRERFEEE